MTSASPKELTQRFYDEIFTGRNVDLIDELVDENFVEHEEFPGLPAGREGAKAFTHMLLGQSRTWSSMSRT